MNKEFVPYELAVKLKELGFDELCFGYYLCKNSAFEVRLEITTNWIDLLPYDSSSCKAPLYQQAFRWFREKYGLYHQMHNRLIDWGVAIRNIQTADIEWSDGNYISYEEAELNCLTKLIEIAEQTNN